MATKKIIRLSFCFLVCGTFHVCGCIQATLHTDLDSYLVNPDACARQECILTAPLADVLARYSLYENKKIEVTAPVLYYRDHGFWTWYMVLEENGRRLRCYTHYYRIEADWSASNLLERAKHEKKPVTVSGKLTKDGIDIQRLSCDTESVSPSYKTPEPPIGLWPY